MIALKKIIFAGITGNTGKEVAKTLSEEYEIVAGVGKHSVGKDIGEILHGVKNDRFVYADLAEALRDHTADVYIDFTKADGVVTNLETAIKHGLDVVVGTTGLQKEYVTEMSALIEDRGQFGMFSSNFAMGVAILEAMGELMKKFYEKSQLSISETHHDSKIDRPSGTALYLQNKLGLHEQPIISRRIPVRTSLHEIVCHTEAEQLMISYEVTDPRVYGEGVKFVLQHMQGLSGVYHDFYSFMKTTQS